MKRLRLPFQRVDCVSLDSLFVEFVEPDVIRSCDEYQLTSENVKDTRRLIFHHLILHICEEVLKNTTSDKIVFYTWRDFHKNRESRLVSLLGELEYCNTITTCIASVRRVFPFRIHIADKTFDYFTYLYSKHSPIAATELKCMSSIEPSMISMSGIKKYVSRYKLTFLDEVYFTKIRTKLLLVA